MDSRSKIDTLLLKNNLPADDSRLEALIQYARTLAQLENTMAVVSDMISGNSIIISGGFGSLLGLDGYDKEDSIWESRILDMMTPEEKEIKFIAELRFFHFLRHLSKKKRHDYYLAARLRFSLPDNKTINVLHRMYYIYDEHSENVQYALCLYSPLYFELRWKSQAVNSITGETEEMATSVNRDILGHRECQVLSLIDEGLKSAEIAERLHISVHTVSRHRQEILAKLRVKNSIEACRLAKRMDLI